MSSGEADKSRIYKTIDGGETWKLQYTDKRAGFFLDSLACDSKNSLPGAERSGGRKIPGAEHRRRRTLEGTSARQNAGGTHRRGRVCGERDVDCDLPRTATFTSGTAARRRARVFHSSDHGVSWTAAETPIAAGNASSGIFSVACGGFLV